MSKSIPYRVRVLVGYTDAAPDIAERTYRAQTPKLAEAITLRYYRKHSPVGTVVTVLQTKKAQE